MTDLNSEEKLKRAQDAFDAGNYKLVRTLCGELQNSGEDGVAKSAIDLRKRTDVDPVQIAVIGGCFVFFVWIVVKYVLH